MAEALKLSHDRKVSPRGYQQPGGVRAGRWVARVPNSFGLPAGYTCPGKTVFCEACYAKNSEQSAGVAEAVAHNYRLLLQAGTVEAMEALLDEMLGRYLKVAAQRSLKPEEMIFRIHWDGDFFSLDYAEAWARAMRKLSWVQFWAYTRSFVEPVNVVPVLVEVPNLVLYLSVDQWNCADAVVVAERYNVMMAPVAETHAEARALVDRGAAVCPENARRIPLMADGVGACVSCRLCPNGRRDVIFSTSHG